MEIFYYDKRKLLWLLVFNALLLSSVIFASESGSVNLGFVSLIAIICLVSFSASLYVVLFPQKLAVLNEDGIKIDHNFMLKWQDIAVAEKKRVPGLMKREIILLTPKESAPYSLTLMQRLCKNSHYGAFSIPLYAMSAVDGESIEKAVARYIPLQN